MLRQFCKKMVAVEKNAVCIHRCFKAKYCTNDLEEVNEVQSERTQGNEISFCRVECIGRVGTQPEEIETKSGQKFVGFLVVCSSSGKYKDAKKWHTVNIHRPGLASIVMSKINAGDRVYIEGKLSYTDGEVQNKNYRIYADNVYLLQHSMKYWNEKSKQIQDEKESSVL